MRHQLVLVCFAFLVASCAPAVSTSTQSLDIQGDDAITRSFVPPVDLGPVVENSPGVTVNPLEDGEWVLVEGFRDQKLSSPGETLGEGDRCFLVGIKGPTKERYQFEAGYVRMGITKEREFGYIIRAADTFDSALGYVQASLLNMESCSAGIDLVVIGQQNTR